MGANFRKRHLDLPPADEPRENIARASVEVGSEERLWLKLTSRIAYEKPSNRHRRPHAAFGEPTLGDAVLEATPPRYHSAVPVEISTRRLVRPYQRLTR